ncbi:MAG: hypothetical protein AVDCRST_MAG28-1907 [uncultured Rubrobacteraceae bacterium]|uniref:Uncharacterized protein n=1 Tax=uncultured Rubrobacteraceae bacterium TaxID=349277 RepID=A0A6J4QQX0_9ACTN|nr:MAG: hypothetical protein AVDCRST_MAG28-1907 [uncultured Rubrobacteraceae bacterium]
MPLPSPASLQRLRFCSQSSLRHRVSGHLAYVVLIALLTLPLLVTFEHCSSDKELRAALLTAAVTILAFPQGPRSRPRHKRYRRSYPHARGPAPLPAGQPRAYPLPPPKRSVLRSAPSPSAEFYLSLARIIHLRQLAGATLLNLATRRTPLRTSSHPMTYHWGVYNYLYFRRSLVSLQDKRSSISLR